MKKTKLFTTMLETLKHVTDVTCTLESFFEQHSRVKLPWNPEIWVIGISKVNVIKSSTNPICITFRTYTGQEKNILVKWEDVRPDRACMTVAFWMNIN